MNTTECTTLEYLAQAAKALYAAKRTTRNGLADDHCVNALKEIRHAMNICVNDSVEESERY